MCPFPPLSFTDCLISLSINSLTPVTFFAQPLLNSLLLAFSFFCFLLSRALMWMEHRDFLQLNKYFQTTCRSLSTALYSTVHRKSHRSFALYLLQKDINRHQNPLRYGASLALTCVRHQPTSIQQGRLKSAWGPEGEGITPGRDSFSMHIIEKGL